MISRQHRTVFVHVPKAAGQSIEQAFLDELGLTWKTRAALLLRPNDDPALGPPRLAHLSAEEYVALGYLSPEDWESFYRFAIVRDPYSRVVSLYRHLGPDMAFGPWVMTWLTDKILAPRDARARWFVKPQVEYLCDSNGTLLVQDVLRFEDLDAAFAHIASRAGLGSEKLPRRNTTGNKPQPDIDVRPTRATLLGREFRRIFLGSRFLRRDRWQDYYDVSSSERIAELYASDFSTFGYPLLPPISTG